MPKVSGLSALEEIMRIAPTPILVVSGVSQRSAKATLAALDAGAIDFILKFEPGQPTARAALEREILAKVRAAAQVPVIRSLRRGRLAAVPATSARTLPGRAGRELAVAVIGASTGGPV